MSEDIDIGLKQKYLRENIIEKGYEAEAFINYLQTLKGWYLRNLENGENIESWTMEELEEVVSNFIETRGVNPGNAEEVKTPIKTIPPELVI